ncbi:CDP-diacylglycerol--serine O-phosphatidyltransferase [Rappaport israeli]|uniref:CDP-diacylglycerol--serine O-phosphatidyltransferase n=1 Tax=Rappaport israeli TaxID=1839807 RepID=UPI00099021C1|nr:CDP-diacylglycerol--serine O-phosphatidyltransferase [Rappaport israeli]
MRGYKTIYILPNSMTTAALFCGFYAILAANDGRFGFAAMLIFSAMIFDGLDGRIARWTKTESNFGVQYDSLSDMVSFGVAPALVLYEWSLHAVETTPFLPAKLGWMSAFIYATCAALRLARFNVQAAEMDKSVFIGLPSPSAAAIVCGYVWVGARYQWQGEALVVVSLIVMLLAGLSMVSNFKYYSFKTFKLQSRLPFSRAILPAALLALLFLEPSPVLFTLFVAYGVSGPIWSIWRLIKKRQLNNK